MSKSRAIATLLALQLLALLLITQTWYSISMAPNGHTVTLGDYTGVDAYASAMPTSLFVLTALLVVGFTVKVARVIALSAALLGALAVTLLTLQAILVRNISALDSSLDRLTGIAQTHGISDLTISQSVYAWLWVAVELLLCLVLAASLYWQKGWKAEPKPTAVEAAGKPRKTTKQQKSTIELWDEQRD